MNGSRYIRDRKNGAVLLVDAQLVESFREKKTVSEEFEAMKAEINTLKNEIAELRILLNQTASK